jgi:pilus assembly protein Flp/PilA
MNRFLTAMGNSVRSFAKEEDGAQVVEYALIIAVVSIGLVLALSNTTTGIGSSFSTLIGRLTTCFTAGATCS